jgi:ATP-dependent Zn protease
LVDAEYVTALHEAAHAFVLSKYFPSVRFSIDIYSDAQAAGHCTPNMQDFYFLYRSYTDEQLRLDTVFSFAGCAAEALLNGEDSPNPQHVWQDLNEGRKRIDKALAYSRQLSQEMKFRLSTRQDEYETECFKRAKELISENRPAVERVAKKLMVVKKLTEEDVKGEGDFAASFTGS